MKIVFSDIQTLGYKMDLRKLEKLGELKVFDNLSDEALREAISDADILITNQNRLHVSNLQLADNLKLICQAGTGYNNIDISYCRERGIAVTNVPDYATISVAQHTFSMLFYLLSHSRYYDDYVKTGKYSSSFNLHWGRDFYELEGKTWGIIGMGKIGKKVAEYASGFNCNVIYYSTTGKNHGHMFNSVSLEQLLRASDIVSIHAPLNENTRNLIGLREIKLMKKSAILLNLGRGGIIAESDLAEALSQDIIFAAGLDVLEKEPMSENHSLNIKKIYNRIFVTPHIAYASVEARERLMNTICDNIISFCGGGRKNRVESII